MKATQDELMLLVRRLFSILAIGSFSVFACAQPNVQLHGSIEGRVILTNNGEALHGAIVEIPALGRSASTDEQGRYRFDQVPPGRYRLLAHLDSTLTEQTQRVEVKTGVVVTANFALAVAPERYEVMVTASGREETGL